MENQANTKHPIHDLIARRRSPYAFSNRRVEPEKLRSILEAARWAPSSYNEQPWSFLIATRDDPLEYDRMLSCLTEGNILWAQRAPVLILSVAKLQFARNQKANRHALHDVGLASANLILQATSLGLVAHAMAGFHAERARSVFSIPEDSEPVAMIAVGYLGDANTLPQALLERELAPRTRKPLEEFVFTSRWGQAAPLVLAEESSKKATRDVSSAMPPLLGDSADGNEDCSRGAW